MGDDTVPAVVAFLASILSVFVCVGLIVPARL